MKQNEYTVTKIQLLSHHHYTLHITCVTNPTIIHVLFVSNVGSPNLLIPAITNHLNIALKRSAHALGEQQLRHPILRTLKLALELRVANPSLLFDTRTACRGNEARVG